MHCNKPVSVLSPVFICSKTYAHHSTQVSVGSCCSVNIVSEIPALHWLNDVIFRHPQNQPHHSPELKAPYDWLIMDFSQHSSCTDCSVINNFSFWSKHWPVFLFCFEIFTCHAVHLFKSVCLSVDFSIFSSYATITTVNFRLFYYPTRNLRSLGEYYSLPVSLRFAMPSVWSLLDLSVLDI